MHPPGFNMNGNYLSLFLTLKASDTLRENSASLVEFSISIKDQETGKHKKLSGSFFSRMINKLLSSHFLTGTIVFSLGRFQFSKKSPSWGWNKFISLEDFKDSSNGYLVKTKCCIEAEVASQTQMQAREEPRARDKSWE